MVSEGNDRQPGRMTKDISKHFQTVIITQGHTENFFYVFVKQITDFLLSEMYPPDNLNDDKGGNNMKDLIISSALLLIVGVMWIQPEWLMI
jgi:hypothetical protein